MGTARIQSTVSSESKPRSTVLVVDDEESFHDVIARYLDNYRVLNAYNGWQMFELLEQHHVDVVLLDLNLPDAKGLKLLERLEAERGDVEVIVITAHSELPNAVEAIKKGAFDFLAKTYENYQQLDQYIERALVHRRHRRKQLEAGARDRWLRDAFDLMVESQSRPMREVIKLARQVAATPLTVLIEGESGVGKEILARFLHLTSGRGDAPFVAINLSAVPSSLLESHLFGHVKGAFTGAERNHVGKFELADGGTLFLDEVGELDAGTQTKLLRVLQEREVERLGAREPSPVDVRVIAATNKKLATEVEQGRFREDLYYRLNVVRLPIPPLRERREELPDLVRLLVDKHSAIMRRDGLTFSADALDVLLDYQWPGNIRELENLVMRMVAINPGKTIEVDDIPTEYCLSTLNRMADLAAQVSPRNDGEQRLYFLARDQFERYLVRLVVRSHGGNRREAARALGVSMSTIKQKLRGDKPANIPD